MVVPTTKQERRYPKTKITDLTVDFKAIFATQSKTDDCERMAEQVLSQIDKIPNLVIDRDDYGNIYVTKGKLKQDEKYPAFVSHVDTVHKIYDTYYINRSEGGNWYAYTEDDGEFMEVGIGGDDKSGIILCIELLHRLTKIKVAFFKDEESGCKGSAAGNLQFFDDCRYAIQIDRKDNCDIITRGAGTELCSREFEELLDTIGKSYGYAHTSGANTDVVKLKDRGLGISAVNLSAAYYHPHTKQEYVNEYDLMNCLEFCLAIAKIKTVYPHTKPVYKAPATTKYTQPTKVSQRRCLICNDSLYYNDGKLCTKCVRDNLILIVKKDGEMVVQESVILDTELPLCSYCDAQLKTPQDFKRQHCHSCAHCKKCDKELRLTSELVSNLCVEHADASDVCGDKLCGAILWTLLEKEAGYCSVCIGFMREWGKVKKCPTSNCGNDLTFDDEIENELCRDCKAYMYGI